MHLQVTLVVFALCLALFCSTTGAPAGGKEKGKAPQSREKVISFYSPQENEFILKEAFTQSQTNDKISWIRMAEMHEDRVKRKVLGFDKNFDYTRKFYKMRFFNGYKIVGDKLCGVPEFPCKRSAPVYPLLQYSHAVRTADNLKHHFKSMRLTHKTSNWKPKKAFSSHPARYTEQEEAFINKELLNDSFKSLPLYGDDVWKALLEKHNLKREQKCKGFSTERSVGGLRRQFLRVMKNEQRVPKEVMARFPRYFVQDQEGTSNTAENQDTNTSVDALPVQLDSGYANDIFDSIMQDLENIQNSVDDEGIDHNLFLG